MDRAKIVSVFDGMAYKLGSLFDGSGGFPLAGSLCGVEPCWAAEVEPYPIAVTRSRFPNMKHLGDISKVNGGEIEPVDIITFGSPCQDLSVAGKRAGLKHEANGDDETTRSGLFMEAVRIIKEMRKATGGQFPRWALWENVPGAFSSQKGEDFRVVLEELIRIVEPGAVMPPVPKAGWAYADHFRGDGWSLAYRVFDSQFWGVPQRRRRIHLVIDLRGECAGEVLFEREGVRGYFAEGRTPWQAAPGHAEGSSGADDRSVEVGERREHGAGRGRQLDGVKAYSFDSLASNSMKSKNPNSGCRAVEVAKTLDTTDPNPCKNQGGIAIVETLPYTEKAYSIQGSMVGRADKNGPQGDGVNEETSFTLNTIDRHCVAYTMKIRSGCEGGGKGALVQEDRSATLATNNDQYLFQPVVYDARGNGDSQTVNTLTGDHNNRITDYSSVVIDGAPAYSMKVIARCGNVLTEQANPICALDYKDPDIVAYAAPVQYIVRRLTPTECARLQGFPDRWGDIDKKDSFTPEEYRFWLEVRNTHAAINGKKVQEYTEAQMLAWYNKLPTDSAEYRMWGNGIALPPALYCILGIVDAMSKGEGL